MKCDLTKLDNLTEFFVYNGGYHSYILKDGNDTYIRSLVFHDKVNGAKVCPGEDLNLDIEKEDKVRHSGWVLKDYLNHFGYKPVSHEHYRKKLPDDGLEIDLELYWDDDIELKIWNKELEVYISCGYVSLSSIQEYEAKLLNKYNIIEKNSSTLLAEMAEDIER